MSNVGIKQTYTACFLYPGIARYSKTEFLQNVLIDKHIDQIAKAFIGAPMTIGHISPAKPNPGDVRIKGKVTNVFLNNEGFVTKEGIFVKADNKYYCDFYLTDEEAMKAADELGFVSCAWEGGTDDFIFPEKDENGKFEKLFYIAVPYDAELKNAEALHMAIVGEPRYEQSKIYTNDKSGESLFNNLNTQPFQIYKKNMSIETKEVQSSIELEKGIFLNYCSAAAEKAREVALSIFSNAKKKNEDAYEDERDAEKRNSKKNSKKKMNEDEEEGDDEEDGEMENSKSKKAKNSKKKMNEDEDGEMENSKSKKAKNAKEEDEEKENSFEVEGEKYSKDEMKEAINCWKNSKKKNEADKTEKKEKTSKENSMTDSEKARYEYSDEETLVSPLVYNGNNIYK